MKGRWVSGTAPRWRKRRVTERQNSVDGGFTLVELLIVCTILPLIIAAISVALVSVLSLQSGVSNRISDSADAQIVSATFEKDVQSAVQLTTNSVPTCGSGRQLLGLEWGLTTTYQTVVSYNQTLSGSLNRQYCASGALLSTSVISGDIPTGQPVPTISPSTDIGPATGNYISTIGVTGVSFAITEPKSNYSYTLLAVPAASSSTGQGSVALPTTSCGFATPGTGTYASTLCFADFSTYQQPAPGSGCETLKAVLANFKLSYCILVSGGPTAPSVFPTYGQSFLGNKGFYTGVPGEPAIYQTPLANGTTTTIAITQIQVSTANGSPATGWSFVSGDAESTDSGEYIQWTIPPGSSGGSNLTLLSNTSDPSASPIGNACGYYSPTPANSSIPNASLTGLGTPQVECDANANETTGNKTGTVMLQAPAPTALTVVMKGKGLQGIFIGLLLPG
jgi:type II secretory pathway pseudopilin PulG